MMTLLVLQVIADLKFITLLCDTSIAHWRLLNLHAYTVETAQKSLQELGEEAQFLYATVTMVTSHGGSTTWIPTQMSSSVPCTSHHVLSKNCIKHCGFRNSLRTFMIKPPADMMFSSMMFGILVSFPCKQCDLHKLNADIFSSQEVAKI